MLQKQQCKFMYKSEYCKRICHSNVRSCSCSCSCSCLLVLVLVLVLLLLNIRQYDKLRRAACISTRRSRKQGAPARQVATSAAR